MYEINYYIDYFSQFLYIFLNCMLLKLFILILNFNFFQHALLFTRKCIKQSYLQKSSNKITANSGCFSKMNWAERVLFKNHIRCDPNFLLSSLSYFFSLLKREIEKKKDSKRPRVLLFYFEPYWIWCHLRIIWSASRLVQNIDAGWAAQPIPTIHPQTHSFPKTTSSLPKAWIRISNKTCLEKKNDHAPFKIDANILSETGMHATSITGMTNLISLSKAIAWSTLTANLASLFPTTDSSYTRYDVRYWNPELSNQASSYVKVDNSLCFLII